MFLYVEKLRSGEKINIEDIKPKKVPNGRAKTIIKKQKYYRKKIRPEKKTDESLPININLIQSLKLEKLFHTMALVPTPDQVFNVFLCDIWILLSFAKCLNWAHRESLCDANILFRNHFYLTQPTPISDVLSKYKS